MNILRDALFALYILFISGCGLFLFAAFYTAISERTDRLRALGHVASGDVRMLSVALRLAIKHFRASNELMKRGENE